MRGEHREPEQRRAARVIVLDEQNRVLLLRGIDSTTTDGESWWFTPGGGLEAGENARQAARREVWEETGIPVDALEGPVFDQVMDFTFENERLYQYEQFFVARVAGTAPHPARQTDRERRTVLGSHWWRLDDLAATTEVVYPNNLAELVRAQLGGSG